MEVSLRESDITLRVLRYGDTAFEVRRSALWDMAGEAIISVMKEFYEGVIARGGLPVRIDEIIESARDTYGRPIDADWIRIAAGYAREIWEGGATVSDMLPFLARKADLIARHLEQSFGVDLAMEAILVVRTMDSFWLEILQAELDAKNREAAARERMVSGATFEAEIQSVVTELRLRSTDLRRRSESSAASAGKVLVFAADLSSGAMQSFDAMQRAASQAAELVVAIDGIGDRMSIAAATARKAQEYATDASRTSTQLAAHARQIDTISELVRTIAKQTSLLALNATIEASRAGDAGRGFAVVAQEVKRLSLQTADAVDAIKSRIDEMQRSTLASLEANRVIEDEVRDVSTASARIILTIEEQRRVISTIGTAIEETVTTSAAISSHVEEIVALAQAVSDDVSEVDRQFSDLDSGLVGLGDRCEIFVERIGRSRLDGMPQPFGG